MKFGIFGGARRGLHDITGDSTGYQDFIDYIRAADEHGFHNVFLTEHHFTGQESLSASLNLLAYLAARTERIRLGTGVVVLPWHNPVLLAEEVATLDVLSGGRVDFGVGRGYRKAEFDAFCVPMDEAWDRYNECLEVVLKAWHSKGRFSHEGKYFRFHDIVVEPTPLQRPHPPIWIASGNTESIVRIADNNYSLLLDQLASDAQIEQRLNTYLDAMAARGHARAPSRVGVARQLHLVKNEDERRAALELRIKGVKNVADLARRPGVVQDEHFERDMVEAGMIGTPDEIIERLNSLAARGVENVLLLNVSATRKSLEFFAREIMPHVNATPVKKAASA
jgi:alkanesulfonate monooxygenase SsuD/methylene tetrahydromethanopterin reductase-like flavin-dependent oxidoreductase (luciferase family)